MIRLVSHVSLCTLFGCLLLSCAGGSARAQDDEPDPSETRESTESSGDNSGDNLPPLQPVPESQSQSLSQPRPLAYDPYRSFVDAPPSYLGPCYPACPMPRRNRFRAFIEYLHLHPGNIAATSYAVPVNGAVIPPPEPRVPVGATAIVDPVYQPGVRLGFGMTFDPCIEWALTYSYFESTTSHSIDVDAANNVVLDALVLHPGTLAADNVYLNAEAGSSLRFHLLDFDRRRIVTDCSYTLGYLFGVRFARLEQEFDSVFVNSTTVEQVATKINFDGAGFRAGLDGEVHASTNGLMLYGQAIGSLLTGRFSSEYAQTDNFQGVVANSSRKDNGLVPILDLEFGLGWTGRNDRWELRAGYLFSAWYNVVSNEAYIRSVQNSQTGDIRDTLTFDGLVARAEFRF
jgi:hypothetical protein